MKKILIMVIVILMLALSACQPTPDEDIVISKVDGVMEDELNSDETLKSKIDVPENWQETFIYDDKITIEVDAEFFIPEVSSFPVYLVKDGQLLRNKWIE